MSWAQGAGAAARRGDAACMGLWKWLSRGSRAGAERDWVSCLGSWEDGGPGGQVAWEVPPEMEEGSGPGKTLDFRPGTMSGGVSPHPPRSHTVLPVPGDCPPCALTMACGCSGHALRGLPRGLPWTCRWLGRGGWCCPEPRGRGGSQSCAARCGARATVPAHACTPGLCSHVKATDPSAEKYLGPSRPKVAFSLFF